MIIIQSGRSDLHHLTEKNSHCLCCGVNLHLIESTGQNSMSPRLQTPPFNGATAAAKVRITENNWNSRAPLGVALGYTIDSFWRSGVEFLSGRSAIEAFLTRKWAKELEYRLIAELWAFTDSKIALRFANEYHDIDGNWYRSYGSEHWDVDSDGLIQRRIESFNDHSIQEADRVLRWPLGPRPDDHPELSDFDL
jgi:nuclear transport factor 2 (NTF2) superfamily protein